MTLLEVVTTTATSDEARALARALVERGLAACAQVAGPVTSTYRWQGQVETAEEYVCLVKTDDSHYAAVEQAILELHSYDVPQIVALPIVAGSRTYLEWLTGQLA